MNTKQPLFKLNALCFALMTVMPVLAIAAPNADNTQTGATDTKTTDKQSKKLPKSKQTNLPTVQLEALKLTQTQELTRTSKDVTGLGKIVKNAETLSKEQVLNIRDLTRYDPGIAVVEQGQGASSGYSIRGMDKNRVAVLVDGLAQAQSYHIQRPVAGGNYANGGAINEIEYENVKAIEISKGANSAEYGSGALSGSVAFVSKNADDLIKDGKDWGVQTKTAYASKNNAWVNSVAAAGKAGGFETAIIYTDRRGTEYKAHDDAYKTTQQITRANAIVDESKRKEWFKIEGEDKPKLQSYITDITETVSAKDYTGKDRLLPNPLKYSSKSLFIRPGYRINNEHYIGAVYEKTKQMFDMQDMTTPKYFTKDDITGKSANNADGGVISRGIYRGDNLGETWHKGRGQNTAQQFTGYGINFARGEFHDEHHTKNRLGLEYVYQNDGNNKWLDKARLSYDKQDIHLDSHRLSTHCSTYPNVDRNCQPDKPFTARESDKHRYNEQRNLFKISLDKQLEIANTTHNVNVQAGYERFNSDLKHDLLHQYGKQEYAAVETRKIPDELKPILIGNSDQAICLANVPFGSQGCNSSNPNWNKYQEFVKNNGGGQVGEKKYKELYDKFYQFNINNKKPDGRTPQTAKTYKPTNFSVQTENLCQSKTNGYADCDGRYIKGQNYHLVLRDNMALGKYVDLGLGLRYDNTKHQSNVAHVDKVVAKNLSYQAGIVVKPTEWLDIAYRYSQGFRMPSFSEMYGWRNGAQKGLDCDGNVLPGGSGWYIGQKTIHCSNLKPEKSINQEIGATFKHNSGRLEVSYFKNRYNNLISHTSGEIKNYKGQKPYTVLSGYYNAQNAELSGVNVLGKLDLNAVNSRLPEGLHSTLAYNHVKVKSKSINPNLVATDIFFDSIQPSRYVLGLGYDHPSQQWGVNAMFTHSAAKNNDELLANEHKIDGTTKEKSTTKARTEPWQTLDLSAYVTLKDNFTLRAGVNNVFNKYYQTWEAVRQTAENNALAPNGTNALHKTSGSYSRYAAPGRNYALALEMKF
ncbi:transferrin binding protein A TbpA [Moraxella macacae 0408225]|uniref:Transferrin binding protein A TbpA n=1 Tax=Moraxella macacae 0408225 TaxID=1230338 RepID=L2F9I6_9GAMM|nr:lactoferrin/transferrin family TonB-dependent receptor [Moraxella macacae]ELA09702.1 transferrin binding protein A TbpA [Moraxella macacae 0408225]